MMLSATIKYSPRTPTRCEIAQLNWMVGRRLTFTHLRLLEITIARSKCVWLPEWIHFCLRQVFMSPSSHHSPGRQVDFNLRALPSPCRTVSYNLFPWSVDDGLELPQECRSFLPRLDFLMDIFNKWREKACFENINSGEMNVVSVLAGKARIKVKVRVPHLF